MLKVAYITSKQLIEQCDKIPVLRGRASMVHELICAYKLDKLMDIIIPKTASEEELCLFHSNYYLSYLKTECSNNESDSSKKNNTFSSDDESNDSDVDDEQLDYGLGYDCPKIKNLWKFARIIGGGSLTAAEQLLNGRQITINWCGGWHHAQRDEAEGFCYINDIAMAIQRLRSKFQRVLYIDLDIHHGNGVENAFAYTKRVFTVSFHQYEAGFFPGSGNINDCGFGQGKGYCVNFPYKMNICGSLYVRYFIKTITEIIQKYVPDVCVIQCGADSITGDPLGGSNLVPENIGVCIKEILSWRIPTMFLGGGGYNFANTSRYWTYLTSVICKLDEKLDNDIPDNDNKYFLKYGPDYELKISPSRLDDNNTENDMEIKYKTIKENLARYGVTKC